MSAWKRDTPHSFALSSESLYASSLLGPPDDIAKCSKLVVSCALGFVRTDLRLGIIVDLMRRLMEFHRVMRAISLSFAVLVSSTALCNAQQRPYELKAADRSAQSLGKEQLLAPEDLVSLLRSSRSKPLILNVGPRMLYAQAHITGAEFIGPGSDAQAIEALKLRVNKLPKTASMVLYCGCCPWEHCPNVAPAYEELRSLGFTNVKVLYIPTNFGVDWVHKGYPTER